MEEIKMEKLTPEEAEQLELTEEMKEELSNGKGDDEDE